jgi:hypothetical protein
MPSTISGQTAKLRYVWSIQVIRTIQPLFVSVLSVLKGNHPHVRPFLYKIHRVFLNISLHSDRSDYI